MPEGEREKGVQEGAPVNPEALIQEEKSILDRVLERINRSEERLKEKAKQLVAALMVATSVACSGPEVEEVLDSNVRIDVGETIPKPDKQLGEFLQVISENPIIGEKLEKRPAEITRLIGYYFILEYIKTNNLKDKGIVDDSFSTHHSLKEVEDGYCFLLRQFESPTKGEKYFSKIGEEQTEELIRPDLIGFYEIGQINAEIAIKDPEFVLDLIRKIQSGSYFVLEKYLYEQGILKKDEGARGDFLTPEEKRIIEDLIIGSRPYESMDGHQIKHVAFQYLADFLRAMKMHAEVALGKTQ